MFTLVVCCRNFLEALDECAPDIIVYNAGTDVLVGDRLGDLSISEQVIIIFDNAA